MQDNKNLTSKRRIISLEHAVEKLSIYMEKMKLADYVELLNDIPRLLWINFISGIARGLGMAMGFTILFAILVIILKDLVKLKLPVIGDFIAELVHLVQESEKLKGK